jgi:hypothetical protein
MSGVDGNPINETPIKLLKRAKKHFGFLPAHLCGTIPGAMYGEVTFSFGIRKLGSNNTGFDLSKVGRLLSNLSLASSIVSF